MGKPMERWASFLKEGNARKRKAAPRPRGKGRPVRPGDVTPGDGPETVEQCKVVAVLDRAGLAYHHSPNGGHRRGRVAAELKRMGTSAGFPDLMIVTPAPVNGAATVVEMKAPGERFKKKPEPDPPWVKPCFSKGQQAWLERLAGFGWNARVAYTHAEALELLDALGYPVAPAARDLAAEGYPLDWTGDAS